MVCRMGILIVAFVAVGLLLRQSFTWADQSSSTPQDVVKLPPPVKTGRMSVEEALSKRRSVRSFGEGVLTFAQLGQLLWSAQGVTEPGRGLRAAPSAGALYPLELYVVTPDGVFKYLPRNHSLRRVKAGDARKALAASALNQRCVARAPASIVITAVYERTSRKYRGRAQRYVDIEVGCAAENVLLQAVALGLGSVAVGAFDDDKVARVIACRGDEKPLLVIPVGEPAR